jgi:hypothetical protein
MTIDNPPARRGQQERFESKAPLLAVYDGRDCIGQLLRRGNGVEAYGADSASLGLFPDTDQAATAVWRRAHKQEPRR